MAGVGAGATDRTGGRAGMLRLLGRAPVLFGAIGLLLAVEAAACLLGPVVIPSQTYLSWYLGPKARSRTAQFLQPASQDAYLVFDSVLGWRNRPGVSRGNWSVDSLGARSVRGARARGPTRPLRVLFLGSSLVNGGAAVSNSETISAYVEDSAIEALNFGTMLYAFDQAYLAYATGLYRLDARIVVVGVPAEPGEGLSNRYVPFRARDEVNMPFLKPRFRLAGDTLVLEPVLPLALWRSEFDTPAFVDSLRGTDGSFGRFAAFARFGQTPIAAGVSALYQRVRGLATAWNGGADRRLFLALLSRLQAVARSHDAAVLVMIVPDGEVTFPGLLRRRLPDRYPAVVAELRERGVVVLDGREALRASGVPAALLYNADGIHLTPAGNQVVAEALRPLLRR